MTYRRNIYRANHLDLDIGYLEHLGAALYELRLIAAKSYPTQYLFLVLGHLKYLKTALYAL